MIKDQISSGIRWATLYQSFNFNANFYRTYEYRYKTLDQVYEDIELWCPLDIRFFIVYWLIKSSNLLAVCHNCIQNNELYFFEIKKNTWTRMKAI